MDSAGNSPVQNQQRKPEVVEGIIGKRRYIDWSKNQPFNIDVRANGIQPEGDVEYLVHWKEYEKATWERPNPNLLNIKGMLRDYDKDEAEKAQKNDQNNVKVEAQRKRSRKALKKGSFDKGHRLREVLGVRRNRFDN